jgi:colanic acid biosynthesis glycosyl transferase WcaI
VLDAARIVSQIDPKVDFCFLGSGLETLRLQERAARERLSTVHFFPQVPMSEVGSYLAAADCLLVNLRADPLFEITIPSKTQAYMSAGRPIIMAVAGDAATLVEQAKAGLVVPPDDARALADAILAMSAMPQHDRDRMAESAGEYYRKRLSLQCGVGAFDALFASIARVKGNVG